MPARSSTTAPRLPPAAAYRRQGHTGLAVLALHGYTSAPWSLRELAQAIAEAGHSVDLPLLPGHGAGLPALSAVTWEQLYTFCERRLLRLQQRHARVVVLGVSVGGGLACALAERHPGVAGLALVNPTTTAWSAAQRSMAQDLLAQGYTLLPPSAPDIADPDQRQPEDEGTPLRPLLSIIEGLSALRPERVRAPMLLLRSRTDHVVDAAHAEVLVQRVQGPQRQVWLERSWHLATCDYDKAQLSAELLAFLGEIQAQPLARRYRVGPDRPPGLGRLLVERLTAEGWEPTDGEDWSLWWGRHTPPDRTLRALGPGRVINHFPGIAVLTRKDTLAWAVQLARRGSGEAKALLHPRTWVMPEDHAALKSAAARAPDAIWIQKPVASSNGRGIRLHADLSRLRPRPGTIVQRYIDRPHLIDGFKYTIRCYLAITSVEPLQAWLYDEGFVKFTTRPFRTDPASLRDRVIHLTNPAVQEANTAVPTSSKNLTHSSYRALLRGMGIDDERLFARVAALARALALAGQPFVVEECQKRLPQPAGRTFELLGLDVLIDARLRPWLIECNLSPSLSVEADDAAVTAQAELTLKRRLLVDLFRLVGLHRAPDPAPPPQALGGFRRLSFTNR